MQIELKDLNYIYSEGLPHETLALRDINLTVNSGEFIAIIGHTGSGKSTLVQHLNGLVKPSSGQVLADGVDINDKSDEARALRRHIGMVFQYPEYQLFEENVIKDVCFGPSNQGFSKEECIEKAKRSLQLVGLDPEEKGQMSPFSLSGGEKRRVAIAGVLAMEPEVLILDEPTAGLDPKGQEDILSMIARLKEERSMTIIWISHCMDDVARLAQRVIVLDMGRVLMDGTPAEVFVRGEELESIGLAVPAAASVMRLIAERGGKVRRDILTREEAADEIIRVFGSN